MTHAESGTLLRFGLGAVIAGGMSAGLVNASTECEEQCDGDCWIGTFCDTCNVGSPNDCFIHWDSGDQECYDNFICHWSCPSCFVC